MALLLPACGSQEGSSARPNLLWIVLDTCRADHLSSYGYERRTTPNLDRLAARGVLFDQAFAQGTWTAISVPSYMTGRYFPSQAVGVYGETEGYRDIRLPAEGEYLISEILHQDGYETAIVTGVSPFFSAQDRLPASFDRLLVPKVKGEAIRFEHLNALALSFLAEERSSPFFLYVHAWDVHFPNDPPPPFDHWLDPTYDARRIEQSGHFGARTVDGTPFSERDKAYLRSLYDGSLEYADAQIGRLLDRLTALRLLENTIVVFSSDHGEALAEDGRSTGHGGYKTFDQVTHVPLIMAGPGVPRDRRIVQLVENVDIVPTLVDLLNIETSAAHDGLSLLPLILGRSGRAPHPFALTTSETRLLSLRGPAFRYESVGQKVERLYKVPDDSGFNRVDVLAANFEAAARMRHYLEEYVIPLQKAAMSGPLLASFLNVDRIAPVRDDESRRRAGVLTAGRESSPSAIGRNDGLWTLHNGQLFAASFSEDTPAIAFDAPVRNGRYDVLVEAFCHDDFGGRPASSLKLRLAGSAQPRVVSCSDAQMHQRRYLLLDAGEHEVVDGSFSATLEEGEQCCWTGVKGFVLVPQTEPARAEFGQLFKGTSESLEALDERTEQLKALGYLE